MDKRAIKNFAINARNLLILRVSNKLSKLGITETGIEEVIRIDSDLIEIKSSGERFSGKDVINRGKLVDELNDRAKNIDFKLAFQTLVEEVSYTWFNRVIAIRFMEVNGYLPGRLRVLSSETKGKTEPDIITSLQDTDIYQELDHSTKTQVTELLMDGSASAVDELYQLVFIKVCNSLNKQLPDLFEKIDDYTEMLFTISYIDDNGIIASLLSIPEEDFDVEKGGQIEIIGWMYQYYNTEPKDKVFKRGNRKIRADEIPAATQLFTPDWIVRYMVENSLGRYYIDQKLANPSETRTEKEIAESFGWNYYLPAAEQPEDVQLQILEERKEKSVFALQELKLMDNAMGSGHILAYAFDVFIKLYEAEGFSSREASELILENNLFGLEIDKRAYQLAYFAMMMKGRQYNRRVLQKNIQLNLFHFENSNDITEEYYYRLKELSPLNTEEFTKTLDIFKNKISKVKNATEIGSIINLQDISLQDIVELRQFINVFDEYTNMDILYGVPENHEKLNKILDMMEVMVTKYTAVVTNPPYLNKMSATLSKYVADNYKDVKTDLFSVFIKMNSNMLREGGYAGYMTPFVWMFIKSYEELRKFLIKNKSISSLVQMEYSAFEEATVPVCCFTIKNTKTEPVGNYFKLSDFKGGMKVQEEKVLEAIQNSSVSYHYQTNQENFNKIPGNPISFWVSENLIHDFVVGKRMDELISPKIGMRTGNNTRFLRQWYEVSYSNSKLNDASKDITEQEVKWIPYNKGGGFKRWYGNYDYVVNWLDNGNEIKENTRRVYPQLGENLSWKITNESYYFLESITWPAITSGRLSMRYREQGSIFDVAGMSAFSDDSDLLLYILGFGNSNVGDYILKILNPTINAQVGDFKSIPILRNSSIETILVANVKENISISRKDWDSTELSWNFSRHLLV